MFDLDFEDIFENAPCGYILTDKDGMIIRANATVAAWTGYSPEEFTGRRFASLLPVMGKVFYETHFAPMLHLQGNFSEVSLELIASGGSTVPVIVNAVERRDTEGQPMSIRFTLFIAAERRSYERVLVEARKMAEAKVQAERADAVLREQFIAVLGHDLRNPVASIASGIHMLGKEELTDRGRKVVRLMEGSVVRATGLIDNVLDFARGRLGGGLTLNRDAKEPLEPVLRQVVSELRSIGPDRVVNAHYDLEEPIDCDRVRIGQLLSNLLGNALTHGDKNMPVRLAAATEDNALVITVANGGKPIPPKALEKLFQPFFRGDIRGRHEGLGLGLHIASEIARAHDGTLTAQSDADQTCFTFKMPLASTKVRDPLPQ